MLFYLVDNSIETFFVKLEGMMRVKEVEEVDIDE